MKRLTLTLGLLALAAMLAACSGASANPATPAAPAGSPSGDAVSVVAKDITFTTPAVARHGRQRRSPSPSTTRTAPRTTS